MLGGTSYTLSDQASLSLGLNLYMAINSHLTFIGDGTSLTTSNETPTQTQLHGHIKYVFGPTGTGAFGFDVQGELSISGYAHLIVDGTAYTGGGGASIPLIKYTSLAAGSAFSAANVDISGFAVGLSPTLNYAADGVYLELAGESPPAPDPTPLPTPAPVTPTPPPTLVSCAFLRHTCCGRAFCHTKYLFLLFAFHMDRDPPMIQPLCLPR